LLRCHADTGADITVAALEYPKAMASRFGLLQVNDRNQVIAFEEKPDRPNPFPIDPRVALVSMGIYVFNTRALVKAVIEDSFRTNSSHDFGRDVIPNSLGSLRVCAYNFSSAAHEPTGYWRDVGTIDAYYRSHMELLLVDSPFDPYNDALWPTYSFGGHISQITAGLDRESGVDSVVSPRSTMSGTRVVQSVISPGVRVEDSCEIQSSILLPGVRVGRGAKIRRAVIDEKAEITEGTEIGFDSEADRSRFWVTDSGTVVVSANATFGNQAHSMRGDRCLGVVIGRRPREYATFLAKTRP
jgi:glucose-1-phosphate adenylyltransferase